jgi:UDP-glucuronate decarboxylase
MEKQISALVTGGAGFIGANLCRRLLADGKRVVCIDNFYSSTESNIADLLRNPDLTFLLHDVMQEFDVPADEIYHLAAPASPVHYQKDPVYTLQTIVVGTVHALQCAQRHGAKLLLYSTSDIYGIPDVHPQNESYPGIVNPNGPRACYDDGKRCAETFCSIPSFRERRYKNLFEYSIPTVHKCTPKTGALSANLLSKCLHGETGLRSMVPVVRRGRFAIIDDLVDGMTV